MYRLRWLLINFSASSLLLILLAACSHPANQMLDAKELQTVLPAPSLIAEWNVGEVRDMAWKPNSQMFVVNHILRGKADNVVQAFDIQTLTSIWTATDSKATDIVFTPDGQFTVESNEFAPFFYWRDLEHGEIVRKGQVQDISQIKDGDCSRGGQIILANARTNTLLVADYAGLIGLRSTNQVNIGQLDLRTGHCESLFSYRGSFDLFDLNSRGTLIAYGGEGQENEVIIWDVEKRVEVCRTSKVDFGRFLPGEDTLAVYRAQKIVFIDSTTCQEQRYLDIAPKHGYEASLTFSSDGELIAIVKEDAIKILAVSTGETLANIPFPKGAGSGSIKPFFNLIRFSPDGKYLLASFYLKDDMDSNQILLWSLRP